MNENNQTLKTTFAAAIENYKKGDFKTAEIYCYKILSIDPNHFDSISMLASISAVNNNFNKAVELLKKAIEVQPKNTRALHNLGTAYKELGKLNEAINYYKQVLQIDPKHTIAHYNLGLVFHKLNEFKTAITPGSSFGYKGFVRASICGDVKDVKKGLRQLVLFTRSIIKV